MNLNQGMYTTDEILKYFIEKELNFEKKNYLVAKFIVCVYLKYNFLF